MMYIDNRRYCVAMEQGTSWQDRISSWIKCRLNPYEYPLRFAIVDVSPREFTVEVTTLKYTEDSPYAQSLHTVEIVKPRKKAFQASPFGVVQVVPTGVGCEIGGFAGDAGPATNLLAATVDFLVTHPNAVNASELNEMADNVMYVEGKALDDFLLGYLGLLPVAGNKIGTFIDVTGIDHLDYVISTLNAGLAVKGIDCSDYKVLTEELGVNIEWAASGRAVGTVLKPDAILDAVQVLVNEGANAVGGVSVIHGVTQEMFSQHLKGNAPNPSGGVEAIITHLISRLFRIPTAHAPLPYYQDLKQSDTGNPTGNPIVNPRASAEFISIPHYFCVLKGLAQAPRLVPLDNLENPPSHLTTVNHIGAVVLPASCLGGIPAIAAQYSEIPVIAVNDNKTVLNVTNEKMQMSNVVEVSSYLEAVGVITALRKGISLTSVRRPLAPAQQVF